MKVKSLIFLFVLGINIIVVPFCEAKSGDPLIYIASPQEGAVVSGRIKIEARVSDSQELGAVRFYIQEPGAKDRYEWYEFSPPYVWGGDGYLLDTAWFEDGNASVVAEYCKKGGKKAIASQRVTFRIENGKPTVDIISPRDNASVEGMAKIEVKAGDSGRVKNKSGIREVAFYIDGGSQARIKASPYEYLWDTRLLDSGAHSIRIVATDAEGLTSAKTIMVKVDSD
jgi:hypothetical protein